MDHEVLTVLVTSISRKVPLLREVRKALVRLGENTRLIGGDTDGEAIGRYFVDGFWKMPPLDALPFDALVEYCRRNGVTVIIPTRDGELPYFANNKVAFAKIGIHVMVSPPAGVEICFDKLAFYEKLHNDHELRVIPTSDDITSLAGSSFVVKERFGAGAKEILLDVPRTEALAFATRLKSPVFQPFVAGKEYSVDLYVTCKGVTKGAVVRSRDVVINGESQVTSTIHCPDMERLAGKLVERIGLEGHVLCQAIVDHSGQFHFVECNCRFGGASTLGISAGLDSFYWFFLECRGESLTPHPFVRCHHELRQIRYPADLVLHDPGF